jgi:hypothetical protein
MTLPPEAQNKYEYTLAIKQVNRGGSSQDRISQARGAIEAFHERQEGHNHNTLAYSSELAQLESDLRVNQLAAKIDAADKRMSKKVMRTLAGIGEDMPAFVNKALRNGAVEVDFPAIGKRDTIEAVQAAIAAAKEKQTKAQMCYAPFDSEWDRIRGEVESKAAAPHIVAHPRITPDQAPRMLEPALVLDVLWPKQTTKHSTGPGSTLYLEQPDALGIVIGLFKEPILAGLYAELLAKYDAAKKAGTPILSAKERAAALKSIKAELDRLQRIEAGLFWAAVEAGSPPDWAHPEMDFAALLGLAC